MGGIIFQLLDKFGTIIVVYCCKQLKQTHYDY